MKVLLSDHLQGGKLDLKLGVLQKSALQMCATIEKALMLIAYPLQLSKGQVPRIF